MENGAAVFLRVKVCLIQVIPTSLEVKKKEKANFHGPQLAFTSYLANCICSLPCIIKDSVP